MTDLERTLRELADAVKRDTIEACAKVAEKNMHSSIMPGHVGKNIAREIRSLAGSARCECDGPDLCEEAGKCMAARCQDCGGIVSDDGYSIDDQKCCFRCQP